MKLRKTMSNMHEVSINSKGTFYFSYETCIAFRTPDYGLIIRENDWGPTTGKHLNYIDPDKSIRISGEDFETMLEDISL